MLHAKAWRPERRGGKRPRNCLQYEAGDAWQRRDRRGRFGQGDKAAKGRRQFIPVDLAQAVRLTVTPLVAEEIARRLINIAVDPEINPDSSIAAAALLIDLLGGEPG